MKDVFQEDTSVKKYAQCDQWSPFNFKGVSKPHAILMGTVKTDQTGHPFRLI